MNTTFELKENHMNTVPATLMCLQPVHIDAILALQQRVYDEIADKQLFITSSREEILNELIHSPDHTFGIFTSSQKLIALGIYKAPGQCPENYGCDFGLSGSALDQIAHVDTTIVDSRFRGNRLQQKLVLLMENLARQEGKNLLCCTVSPYNPHSLNTFLNLGFVIRQDCIKYGGVRRYVLAKEL